MLCKQSHRIEWLMQKLNKFLTLQIYLLLGTKEKTQKKYKEMSEDQVEKPTTNDVKEEAKKIPATQGGVDAADDKDKGVVTEASGGQVHILSH